MFSPEKLSTAKIAKNSAKGAKPLCSRSKAPISNRPGRTSQHQMRRNGVITLGPFFFAKKSLQRGIGGNCQLGAGQYDRGERRLGQVRERNIVKTDQRHVVGNLQSSFVNRSQRSNRGEIVRG